MASSSALVDEFGRDIVRCSDGSRVDARRGERDAYRRSSTDGRRSDDRRPARDDSGRDGGNRLSSRFDDDRDRGRGVGRDDSRAGSRGGMNERARSGTGRERGSDRLPADDAMDGSRDDRRAGHASRFSSTRGRSASPHRKSGLAAARGVREDSDAAVACAGEADPTREYDEYTGEVGARYSSPEAPALLPFHVWAARRREDLHAIARAGSSSVPSISVEGMTLSLEAPVHVWRGVYDAYRTRVRSAMCEDMLAAHGHEAWFKAMYDPTAASPIATARVEACRAASARVCAAIRDGSLLACLPVCGGTFTQSHGGLDDGLQHAYKTLAHVMQRGEGEDGRHDSSRVHDLDAVLAAARVAARAHTYDPARTRVLVVTGVHPGIPQSAVEAAITSCGDASADALSRAITTVCEQARAKRPRVSDAVLAEDAELPPLSDDVDAHMARLNARVPQPVCIQTASPLHTAAAAYRRNVWIEYACAEDAQIAHVLLQHVRVDVPPHMDAATHTLETKRVVAMLADAYLKADAAAVELPPREPALSSALARAPAHATALADAEAVRLATLRVPDPSRTSVATHPRGCFFSTSLHVHSGVSVVAGGAPRARTSIAQSLYPYGTGHTHSIASWACEAAYSRTHLQDALALAAALDAANCVTSPDEQGGHVSPSASPLSAALHDVASAGSHFTTLEALDASIFYLRHVHIYDFYSGVQCDTPGDLRQCVGDGYKRAATCDHTHTDVHTHAQAAVATQSSGGPAPADAVTDPVSEAAANGEGVGVAEQDGAGDAAEEDAAPAPAVPVGEDAAPAPAVPVGIEEDTMAVPINTSVTSPASSSVWAFTRMTERAQSAAQSWARRLNDRLRARIAAAKVQVAYDAPRAATDVDGATAAGVASTSAPLVPVYVKDAQPKRLDLIHALAARLDQVEAALVASIPDTAALLPLYASQLTITQASSTVHKDDSTRMIAYIHGPDAATIDARTHCRVCQKVFKAPVFAVKHLHNKHTAEVQRALAHTRACVGATLHGLLTTQIMTRLYYEDARRPMPYVDPAEVASLAESAERERAQAHAAHAQAARGLLGAAPSHTPIATHTRAGGGVLGIAPGSSQPPLYIVKQQPLMPRSSPAYRDSDAPVSAPMLSPALPKPDYGANIVSYEDI